MKMMLCKLIGFSILIAFGVLRTEALFASNMSNIKAEDKVLRERKISRIEAKRKRGYNGRTAEKEGRKTSEVIGGFSIQEARDFVELIGAKIIQLLQDKGISRNEQETRYRRILDEHFDMRAIAIYTLGRYRRNSDPAKIDEFVELFTQLTVEHYVDQFKKYKGQKLKLKYREYKKGPYLSVSSEIVQSDAKNIDVKWLIRKRRDGSLAVYELEVEGVGLKKTKRRIYSVTLREKGLEGLIQDMKKELQKYNGLAYQR